MVKNVPTSKSVYRMDVSNGHICAVWAPQIHVLIFFLLGTSVCNGDSGGGLVFPKPGTSGPNTVWEIRGIVSNTVPKPDNTCDPAYYVIFTDVAKYLDWIQDKTKS